MATKHRRKEPQMEAERHRQRIARCTALMRESGADAEYWDFCVRFLHLYEGCQKARLSISVKGLDTYLWAVPGAK